MLPKNIPEDINIEELLLYFPKGKCKVEINGMHKRNSYYDIVDLHEDKKNILHVEAGRNSIYHVLPEFMFHPIDRFESLNNEEERKRFSAEHDLLEQEINQAKEFFAPIDLLLLQQKMEVREKTRWFTEKDQVLIEILTDRLSVKQKDNRFIRQVIPLIPSCRYIRGNRTLITMLLRKVFMEEGLKIDLHKEHIEFTDTTPRYDDSLGAVLDSSYLGNVYDENVTVYDIHYWSDDECNDQFLEFVDEVEEFRLFLQDYVMSVEEILLFNIITDGEPVKLEEEDSYYYLNYNTNI